MTDVSVHVTGSPTDVADVMRRMHGAPIAKTAEPDLVDTAGMVVKAVPERRYVLGVAYQAGPDPKITRGADGRRDYITADELEQSAWAFVAKGAQVGLAHAGYFATGDVHAEDGTTGCATVVESYIWRGPDWVVKADDDEIVVKAGDWLVGAILDPPAWELWKRGEITGWSPLGTATRRTRRPAVAKSSDQAQLTMNVTGPNDQINAFARLAAVIGQLGSVGASRTIQIDVDGDGAAALRFDLGGLDPAPLPDDGLDDDIIRLPGIGN